MKHVLGFLPWLVLAAGLVAVAVCGKDLLDRHRLESGGRLTSAVVKWSATHGKTKRIRVSYVDANGVDRTKDFTVYSSQYSPGQAVDVIFLPADPTVAVLGPSEAGVTRTQDTAGCAVGGAFVLISLAWLVANFRGRPEAA